MVADGFYQLGCQDEDYLVHDYDENSDDILVSDGPNLVRVVVVAGVSLLDGNLAH